MKNLTKLLARKSVSVLPIIFTITVFAFLIRIFDFKDIVESVTSLSTSAVISTLVISIFFNVLINGLLTWMIARDLGCTKLTLLKSISLRWASLPLKLVMPFKAGELSKVLYLTRTSMMSTADAVLLFALNKALYLSQVALLLLPGMLGLMDSKMIWIIIMIFMLFSIGLYKPILHSLMKKNTSSVLVKVLSISGPFSAKLCIYLLISLAPLFSAYINTSILLEEKGMKIEPVKTIRLIYLQEIASLSSFTLAGAGIREALMPALIDINPTNPDENEAASVIGAGIAVTFAEYFFPAITGLFFLPFLIRGVKDQKST